MGFCGCAGQQGPKILHSCFTQFSDYIQGTVPSECHMKNVFSLSNYPFECEVQCSKARGEFLVNMLRRSDSCLRGEGWAKKNCKFTKRSS